MNLRPLLRSRLAWALATVIVLAAAAAAWLAISESTAPPPYRTQPVERGRLTQTVSANGTLNPVVLVNVGTQVSGTVTRLRADFNDHVERGQVLLELDPALLKAQVRQSEAAVAGAQAALDLARANEARQRGLFEQEYISRQDIDQAEQARKSSAAQLDLALAQLSHDRTNLAYTVIRSPVSGVVVDRQVDLGQTVAASFQTPTLFRIAQDLRKMQIDASLAEADVGQIRVGQTARFDVDAFPNRSFQGKVLQIRLNPTTQQNVVTYDVVVAVDNPDQILLPGMTAYVNFTVAERAEAIKVPNAALRFKPQDAPNAVDRRGEAHGAGVGTVYQARQNGLVAVAVRTGITDNRFTEVLGSELAAGDAVVVEDTRVAAAPAPAGGALRLRMF
jgi:HlyD family secretion protein